MCVLIIANLANFCEGAKTVKEGAKIIFPIVLPNILIFDYLLFFFLSFKVFLSTKVLLPTKFTSTTINLTGSASVKAKLYKFANNLTY